MRRTAVSHRSVSASVSAARFAGSRIDIPANATSLRLSIQRISPAGTFKLYASTGNPPRFRATERPPIRAEELTPDVDGRITWSPDGDPVLPRCETLYLAVITEDLSSINAALFQLTAELETDGTSASCDAVVDAGGTGQHHSGYQ